MVAIGCLAPIILGVAGVLLGHWLIGPEGILWGGGAGLALGGMMLGAMAWLMRRLKN